MTGDEAAPVFGDLLVRQVTWEADRVVSLRLVDPGGHALPAWQPGAHLDVVLPSGLVRQYSLCGRPDDRSAYRVAVLLERESRGGSREVHETALAGRRIGVRGPRNRFELVAADSYLFLAGGIGVTPILPMIGAAARGGTPWQLVYGGRSRDSMAFLAEIGEYQGGCAHIVAEDERGFPDFDAILAAAPASAAVYCCGPPAMLDVVADCCERQSRTASLHTERFTTGGADAGHVPAAAGEFEVELARSGTVLTVPPDKPLLQVLLGADPSLLYSCEQGYCGTCEVKVLAGEPEHHDTVLTDEERQEGKMMVCVGRSKSRRLVLDL